MRAPSALGRSLTFTPIITGGAWLEKKAANKTTRLYWYLRWRDYENRRPDGRPVKRTRYIGPVMKEKVTT